MTSCEDPRMKEEGPNMEDKEQHTGVTIFRLSSLIIVFVVERRLFSL